ncbi:hypothetical protein Ssi02_60770 [Sinosporangium siamense]|uniref:Cell envelope-related transcriptional attenuator domain-containing protein n=2 Tax=Sinosporangium siamense TaxID=1367973 RepID=A0A919RP69_9ACTN|nr:hypothetical protein Ssi02_60770 [Sinosporangium siamense]
MALPTQGEPMMPAPSQRGAAKPKKATPVDPTMALPAHGEPMMGAPPKPAGRSGTAKPGKAGAAKAGAAKAGAAKAHNAGPADAAKSNKAGQAKSHKEPPAKPGASKGKGSAVQSTSSASGSPGRPGRVYGKERSGKTPVRPMRPSSEDGGSALRSAFDRFRGGGGGNGGSTGSGKGGGLGDPRRTVRIVLRVLAGLLVVLLVASIAGYFWINGRLTANDKVLVDYEGRPADSAGQNWLLVGSDSRKGLSKADRRRLATGRAVGQRTDTMMLLHIPDDGRPLLISLPRDSYVPIHNKGRNKLNAAYAFGGAPLLARTVEEVTGLRLDHYMEVGFAGFVDIVDAVGGVNICVKQPLKDPKAGINLKKGCQDMDGGTALGYVRTRVTGGLPDLDRAQRQRQFFAAVVDKASSPGTLINPFKMVPLATSATDSVSVGPTTSAFNLLSLGLAMGNKPITTSVPVTPADVPGVGSVLQWQRDKALSLFNALKNGTPVPKDALTTEK